MNPHSGKARTAVLAICAFAIALPLGWIMARKPQPAKGESPPAVRIRSERRADNNSEKARNAVVMADIRKSGSMVDRMRRTIALANSIPDSAIDGWLDEARFKPGDGYDFTLFTRMLTDRRLVSRPEESTPAGKLAAFLKLAACGLPESEESMSKSMELFALLAEKNPAALEAALGQLLIPYRSERGGHGRTD